MKCTLGNHSLKIFARLLRFLAKFSNEIFLEGISDGIILRVIKNSHTACCTVKFNEYFFTNYQLSDDGDGEANKCRVSSRPLLQIIRNIKTISCCELHLDAINERLNINIIKTKGVRVENKISIMENEDFVGFSDKNMDNSIIEAHPKILYNLFKNVPKKLTELSMEVTKDRVTFKNHIVHPEKDVQTVRLEWKLNTDEFLSYDLLKSTKLILPLQEFLSIIELADVSGANLKMQFTSDGKPLVLLIEDQNSYSVRLIMSTLNEASLRSLRKPKGITSYKQLIGSYCEKRKSISAVELQSLDSMSDNEVRLAVSPCVSEFASDRNAGKKANAPDSSTSTFLRNQNKRKSTNASIINHDENNANNGDENSVNSKSKRRRTIEDEEREEEEILRMVVDLEGDDDIVPANISQANNNTNISNSPTMNFLNDISQTDSGLRPRDTVIASESLQSESIRLEIERAAIPTEMPESINTENVLALRRIPREQKLKMVKANEKVGKLFGTVLKNRNVSSPPTAFGRMLAANSDEED